MSELLPILDDRYAATRKALQAQQWRFTSGSPDTVVTPAAFAPLASTPAKPITVDPASRFQQIFGFGAAMTEASAYLIMRRLSPSQRCNLLYEMFGPGGLSTLRIGVGGSDFGIGRWYGCDPTTNGKLTTAAVAGDTSIATNLPYPSGVELRIDQGSTGGQSELVMTTGASTGSGPYATPVTALQFNHPINRLVVDTDRNFTKFTLSRGRSLLIPLLKEVLAINPNVRIHAAVWTVPDWMRTTVLFANNGRLFDDSRANLATYLVKFVQAMAAEGIPLYSLSPQNEPCAPDASFIYYTPADYADLITSFIGPAFKAARLSTKILAHDHHYAYGQWAIDMLAEPSVRQYIGAIGWHGYGGSPYLVADTQRAYPSVEQHFTEMRTLQADDYPTSVAIMAGDVLIGSLRGGVSSVTLWNLALDENGLPSYDTLGRRGVITIPSNGSGVVVRNVEYYFIKRLAALLQAGARRIASTTYSLGKTGTDLQSVAFVNPDDSVVVMAYNPTGGAITTQIVDGRTGQGFSATLAAGEVSFFAWGTTDIKRAADPSPPVLPVATTQPTVATQASFQNTGQVDKVHSQSFSVPAGSNRALLVVVQTGAGNQGVSSALSVEYGGVPLQLIEAADTYNDSQTGQRAVHVFALLNPPVGSATLEVRLHVEAPFNGRILSLVNVAQKEAFGVGRVATSASATTVSVSLDNVLATDLILSGLGARAGSAVTAGASQTILAQTAAGNSRLATSTAMGLGTVTQSWTLASADAAAMWAVAIHGA